MNASALIDYIHAANGKGNKSGLLHMRRLLDDMNVSLAGVPVIHVAGTNGKGSVCAMVESILRSAGYKTGLYTSPYLQEYQERIRINGRPVSDETFEKAGNHMVACTEALRREGIYPTVFEMGTAVCFESFLLEKVDVAIVEVGMGGRLDPTNVVTPSVSVITAIGLDHMKVLGDTVEKIAFEKAGIIKPGVPVVLSDNPESVQGVVSARAGQLGSCMYNVMPAENVTLHAHGAFLDAVLPFGRLNHFELPLPGKHQVRNCVTALTACSLLNNSVLPISHDAMREGIRNVVWPGRLEWVGDRILLDGAHNGHGWQALTAYAKQYLPYEKCVLLFGVMKDHETEELLTLASSVAPRAVTVVPDEHRGQDAEETAARLREKGVDARPAPSMAEGLYRARALAGDDGIVIAAGSLYLVGEMRRCLGLPV